jgi:itaconate CoA-transferase
MLPLKGITVVSLEQAVAAPFATRQLADLGARIIKIERPDGGDFARGYDATVQGLSSYFVWLNRSKESLTLDLKRPDIRDLLAKLIERADVFVQNLAPGAADRLGMSAGELCNRLPRLIVCNVSGYGSSGPYASKKAYDLLVQSEVGLLSITGSDAFPARVGISVADIAAGMYAYSGILTALIARSASGRGTTVDVSLFDALGEWMGQPAYYAGYSGAAAPRSGAHHASIAPYGPVRVGDGGQIYLGIQNAREWSRFCRTVLERSDLEEDARFRTNTLRVENRQVLHDAIESAFARLTIADVVARLDAAQIAWARMNSVADYLNHPQLQARQCWRDIESPAGTLRAMVPPVRMDGVEPALGAVPALGQHTESILEELGVDRAMVDAWRREGAI